MMDQETHTQRQTRLLLGFEHLSEVIGALTDEECEICLLPVSRVLETVLGRRQFPLTAQRVVAEKVEKEEEKKKRVREDEDERRVSQRKLGKRWDPRLEGTRVHRVVDLKQGDIMLVETTTSSTPTKPDHVLVFPDDVDTVNTNWWPRMLDYFRHHPLPASYHKTAFGSWCLAHGGRK